MCQFMLSSFKKKKETSMLLDTKQREKSDSEKMIIACLPEIKGEIGI